MLIFTIFAKKSYLRDTYCRVICQKRKRDTNEYGYELQLYNYSFFVYVLIDGVGLCTPKELMLKIFFILGLIISC